MKLLRLSTQLHKWIGLVVGIQVLFWVGGGLVMTVLPIETVRGEHHAAKPAVAPLTMTDALPVAEAARRAGVTPIEARLHATPRGPVWTFKPVEGAPVSVAAATGDRLPPLTAAQASALAQGAYVGDGRVLSAVLLATAPQETRKEGPLWRVDFNDGERTSLYLAPDTGEVVSRRSGVWRFYDFFWRLHVMDWRNGEDFNHPLIILVTALTLAIVVTGFILLWIRLGRDLLVLRARKAG